MNAKCHGGAGDQSAVATCDGLMKWGHSGVQKGETGSVPGRHASRGERRGGRSVALTEAMVQSPGLTGGRSNETEPRVSTGLDRELSHGLRLGVFLLGHREPYDQKSRVEMMQGCVSLLPSDDQHVAHPMDLMPG